MSRKSNFHCLQEVRNWSVDDVVKTLRNSGLGECADACKKRDIDGSTLVDLSEMSLGLWKRDLGLSNIRKLTTLIQEINKDPAKFIINNNVSYPSQDAVRKENSHSPRENRDLMKPKKITNSMKGLHSMHKQSHTTNTEDDDSWGSDFDDDMEDKSPMNHRKHLRQTASNNHVGPKLSNPPMSKIQNQPLKTIPRHFQALNSEASNVSSNVSSQSNNNIRTPMKLNIPVAFATNSGTNTSNGLATNQNKSKPVVANKRREFDKLNQEQHTDIVNALKEKLSSSGKGIIPPRPQVLPPKPAVMERKPNLPKPPPFMGEDKSAIQNIINNIEMNDEYYESFDSECFSLSDTLSVRHSVKPEETSVQSTQLPTTQFNQRVNSQATSRNNEEHLLNQVKAPPVVPSRMKEVVHDLPQEKLSSPYEMKKHENNEINEQAWTADQEEVYESIPENGGMFPHSSESYDYYLQPIPPPIPPVPAAQPLLTAPAVPPTSTMPPLPAVPTVPPSSNQSYTTEEQSKIPNNNNAKYSSKSAKEKPVPLWPSHQQISLPSMPPKIKGLYNITNQEKSPAQDIKKTNSSPSPHPTSIASLDHLHRPGGPSSRPLPAPPLPSSSSHLSSNVSSESRKICPPTIPQMPWYFKVDRKTAENMLSNSPDGTFMVRPSTQKLHPLTLTLKYGVRCYNICVRKRPDGKYALGSEKPTELCFNSIEELIANYLSEELVLYTNGEQSGSVLLTSPPK